MLIDYSSDDSGQVHRLVVISGNCTLQIDYSGDFQALYDGFKRLFTLPERFYVPEDCRGQSSKFAEFLSLRLS